MSVAVRKRSWEEHVTQRMGLLLHPDAPAPTCHHGLVADSLHTSMEKEGVLSRGHHQRWASLPDCCQASELSSCPEQTLGNVSRELVGNDTCDGEEGLLSLEASTETLVHVSDEESDTETKLGAGNHWTSREREGAGQCRLNGTGAFVEMPPGSEEGQECPVSLGALGRVRVPDHNSKDWDPTGDKQELGSNLRAIRIRETPKSDFSETLSANEIQPERQLFHSAVIAQQRRKCADTIKDRNERRAGEALQDGCSASHCAGQALQDGCSASHCAEQALQDGSASSHCAGRVQPRALCGDPPCCLHPLDQSGVSHSHSVPQNKHPPDAGSGEGGPLEHGTPPMTTGELCGGQVTLREKKEVREDRGRGRLDSMALLIMKLDQLDRDIENALSTSPSLASPQVQQPQQSPVPDQESREESGENGGPRNQDQVDLSPNQEAAALGVSPASVSPTTSSATKPKVSALPSAVEKGKAEIEAKEACDWLRAAGFPQYAQLYEDLLFPIDIMLVKREHDFLDRDSIEALYRRLNTLNKCAVMKLEISPHRKRVRTLMAHWQPQRLTATTMPQRAAVLRPWGAASLPLQSSHCVLWTSNAEAASVESLLMLLGQPPEPRRDGLGWAGQDGKACWYFHGVNAVHPGAPKEPGVGTNDMTPFLLLRGHDREDFGVSRPGAFPTLPPHRSVGKIQRYNRAVPKFMKRLKVPDYKDRSVFGVPLSINVQRTGQPLPQSIQQAMGYLYNQCLDQVGLFRKSGVKSRIQALRQMNESSMAHVSYDGQSAYDVADMLKQYFRDLPEPLMTSKLSETFLQIYQYVPKDQRLQAIQAAIMLLPDENREVLQTLLCFLSEVTAAVKENQMTPTNLAVCLAPSLFHLNTLKRENSSPRVMQRKQSLGKPDQKDLNENLAATQGLAHMIAECHKLFQVPEEMSRCRNSYSEQELRPLSLEALGRLSGQDTSDYRHFLQDCVDSLFKEAKDKFKGWVSHPTSEQAELAYKKVSEGPPLRLWKSTIEVPAKAEDVLNRLLKEQHIWDPDLLDAKVIEILDSQTEIYQFVRSSMAPHPARDHVVLRTWRTNLPRGVCMLLLTSVDHAQAPVIGVRVNVLLARYLVEPCGARRSKLTYMCRSDLRGHMPEWYTKAFGHLCVAEVVKIRDSFSRPSLDPKDGKSR
ncbi:rho GTPase-activating protein 7 [Petaurus breviceps papuanus]|uniref:rho GTPase-activating protein 7 n=1 Tax=Petaurus breviceps papuanus TaxID=3040969 RepID=UPI0036D7890F